MFLNKNNDILDFFFFFFCMALDQSNVESSESQLAILSHTLHTELHGQKGSELQVYAGLY